MCTFFFSADVNVHVEINLKKEKKSKNLSKGKHRSYNDVNMAAHVIIFL